MGLEKSFLRVGRPQTMRKSLIKYGLGLSLLIGLIGCSGSIGFFTISLIDVPSTIRYGSSPPLLISWIGFPTFPVTVDLKSVFCSGQNFTCTDFNHTIYSRTNPLRLSMTCRGTSGSPPGSATWEVVVRDSRGVTTPPRRFAVGCI